MNRQNRFFSLSKNYVCIVSFMLLGFITLLTAKPPDDLPGEEITEDQYFDFLTPRDSIIKKVPKTSPLSTTWLDRAAKTWDAPPIQIQLAQDKEKMLMGMGAVYIPYMSDPNLEAEIEIFDPTGKVVASGKIGRKYSFVKEVRGLGLILGMELDLPCAPIVTACMEEGVLINCAQEKVLRFMPPLIVFEEEIDLLVEVLDRVLDQTKKEI